VDSVGYADFFLYTGALGLPAVLLIIYLLIQQNKADSVATETGQN